MKFFKKLKSSNFWVSMISAVVLILQAVFNVDIKTEYLNQIILGILGVLVMTGIVTDSPSDEVTVKQNVDFDAIKDNITSMFAQISATLQTDVTNVMSEISYATQNILANAKVENVVQQNINSVSNKNVAEQVEKFEEVISLIDTEAVEKIEVVDQVQCEQEEIFAIQPMQEITSNQTHQSEIQVTDAPKNEL